MTCTLHIFMKHIRLMELVQDMNLMTQKASIRRNTMRFIEVMDHLRSSNMLSIQLERLIRLRNQMQLATGSKNMDTSLTSMVLMSTMRTAPENAIMKNVTLITIVRELNVIRRIVI
jgi:hypothetical protein